MSAKNQFKSLEIKSDTVPGASRRRYPPESNADLDVWSPSPEALAENQAQAGLIRSTRRAERRARFTTREALAYGTAVLALITGAAEYGHYSNHHGAGGSDQKNTPAKVHNR